MAMVLPNIISQNQTRFVKGRSITENGLLAQEIIRDINLRNRNTNVMVTLDMTKAYDRVCWIFLTKALWRFGFSEVIIDMVWRLLSNNWYFVLINEYSYDFFKSSKGVKQGDPLSPTLFIIVAEVLSRGLNLLLSDNQFKGYGLPKWSSVINLLSYADDVILFCSGDKTSIYKMMSIPVYTLSAMNPPKKVIKQMHQILAKFFWGSLKNVKIRHWVAWEDLCYPREEGGLGFRSLYDVSKALFAKLWWNFRTATNSLWGTYMGNKYCKKFHPIITRNAGASHVWRKMTKLGALYYEEELQAGEEEIEVQEFIINGVWDVEKLRTSLSEDMVIHIGENIKPDIGGAENDKA
ncbi:uncharacterized protein LOC107865311 [Capsicum annuum]|uniref:uncharacterized protein LOC107865311 n=1 Tax=Capsicum annuum TaxID=4072 RepID=UPI0007BFA826|nr:uncharacterized protein LOC107865311 [Capsicum annuum]